MNKFKAALDRFEQLDLNNYSAELKEIITDTNLYQFRIKKGTGKLTIIQFNTDGNYVIFIQESVK